MKGFFKTFFASLLALLVFTLFALFVFLGFVANISAGNKPVVPSKAVLVLNLSEQFRERPQNNVLNSLLNGVDEELPTLYDVVRMIRYAVSDSSVKGMYILCGNNANDFAASEELRAAVATFRESGKFVIAYGETISQKGYYVGSVADKIYCHPEGGVDWTGFAVNMTFLKGTLDKLDIKPQVFYAGKFKSATEPFRETQMTEANRLQTTVWLEGLYGHFLQAAAEARKTDTATLRSLAVKGLVQTAHDAKRYGLVDDLKYDDQVKAAISSLLRSDPDKAIGFISMKDYSQGASWNKGSGGRIAVIVAEGDIVSGAGEEEQVGSDVYRNLIRKARLDKDVKAIVLRVNSPGGSALASDVIWRELSLAKNSKPVVVSMGDVAASGGYYISCNADSVFVDANSITGSIGVFTFLPDISGFMRNKLGITFDGVKTAPYADMGNISRPLSEPERRMLQAGVDSVYQAFLSKVAEGRRKGVEAIDSIAQGRVWTGTDAVRIGLADRIGGLQHAVDCAARMARLDSYRVRMYPEKKGILEQLFKDYKKSIRADILKTEIGEDQVTLLRQLKQVKDIMGVTQARLPFSYSVY